MAEELTDAEKAAKKEQVLQRVTTELAAAGLNVIRSGDDVTVYEEKTPDQGGNEQAR